MHPNFVPVPGISYSGIRWGNPTSRVALCTLWGRVDHPRDADDYYMIGNCVSPAGVGHVVRTLLANLQIETLIIDGPDLSGTRGQLLYALCGDGDGHLRLDGAQGVVLVEKRWDGDNELLGFNLSKNRERVILPVPPPPPGLVGTRRGPPARTFIGETLWSVWPRLLGEVCRHGAESPTAYGTRQRELLAVSWSFGVAATLARVPEWLPAVTFPAGNGSLQTVLDRYAAQHFLGTAPRPEGVDYVYSSRLRTKWDDQIARCIETLRKDPEQRRAVAVTWDVGERGRHAEAYVGARIAEIPLVQAVQALLREQGLPIGYDWTGHGSARGNPALLADIAPKMIGACARATHAVFLLANGEQSPQRGAHVEMGAALAGGARVFVWTPPEHAASVDLSGPRGLSFYAHPNVTLAVCPRGAVLDAVRHWLTTTPPVTKGPSDAAAKNPPCLVMLWFRRDADGSLYTHATFRSHDLLRAAPSNAWGICRLAEHVASQLDWPVGKLTITSLSGHLYADCYQAAEKIAQERGRSTYEDDDRAILRVRATDEGVAVDLLGEDGTTLATEEGSAAVVEQAVLRNGWTATLSHALWCGREIGRLSKDRP